MHHGVFLLILEASLLEADFDYHLAILLLIIVCVCNNCSSSLRIMQNE